MSLTAAIVLCALSDSASAACEVRVKEMSEAVVYEKACELGSMNALNAVIHMLEKDISFQVLAADAYCYPTKDAAAEIDRVVVYLESAGFPVRVRMYK